MVSLQLDDSDYMLHDGGLLLTESKELAVVQVVAVVVVWFVE